MLDWYSGEENTLEVSFHHANFHLPLDNQVIHPMENCTKLSGKFGKVWERGTQIQNIFSIHEISNRLPMIFPSKTDICSYIIIIYIFFIIIVYASVTCITKYIKMCILLHNRNCRLIIDSLTNTQRLRVIKKYSYTEKNIFISATIHRKMHFQSYQIELL